MGASAADSVVGSFSDCPHCGAERVASPNNRIVFAEDELAAVERFLEGRCFPCWYSENVVTVEEVEGRAVIRQANADSRQQLRQQAIAIAGGRKGMWLDEVKCHHCQNDATLVVVGNGGKLTQIKVLCNQCRTYWL